MIILNVLQMFIWDTLEVSFSSIFSFLLSNCTIKSGQNLVKQISSLLKKLIVDVLKIVSDTKWELTTLHKLVVSYISKDGKKETLNKETQ